MKSKTTKEKLLFILKKNSSATMDVLMTHLRISEPAIRKHLHEMERQGLVLKEARRQEIGRPYFTYRLTKKGHGQFPNQYEQLPVELLEDLEEMQGPKTVQALLYKWMLREEGHLAEELEDADFDEKVRKFVEIQNRAGYMMDAEQDVNGDYILLNYHCPIANVAAKYRTVCTNEKEMYNHLFEETNVVSENFITQGSPVCKWRIHSPDFTRTDNQNKTSEPW